MIRRNRIVSVANSTGAQSQFKLQGSNKVFEVSGVFVGTVQMEGSNDNGVTWVNIGAAQTAAGRLTDTVLWDLVRGNVTAYTSGNINVDLIEEF